MLEEKLTSTNLRREYEENGFSSTEKHRQNRGLAMAFLKQIISVHSWCLRYAAPWHQRTLYSSDCCGGDVSAARYRWVVDVKFEPLWNRGNPTYMSFMDNVSIMTSTIKRTQRTLISLVKIRHYVQARNLTQRNFRAWESLKNLCKYYKQHSRTRDSIGKVIRNIKDSEQT